MTAPYTNAFPGPRLDSDAVPLRQAHPGLTIREHFAAMALQGLLANPETAQAITDGVSAVIKLNRTARSAVCFADALILELNK